MPETLHEQFLGSAENVMQFAVNLVVENRDIEASNFAAECEKFMKDELGRMLQNLVLEASVVAFGLDAETVQYVFAHD